MVGVELKRVVLGQKGQWWAEMVAIGLKKGSGGPKQLLLG